MGLSLKGGAGSALVSPDPALLPFMSSSPWRLGVALTATFAADADTRNTAMVLNLATAGKVWANYDQFSHPVALAADSDPIAVVTDSFHTTSAIPPGGTWNERIPATARIAAGTDQHMHVITPDRRTVLEHFATTRTDSTHYTTTRRHAVSLLGSGLGPQNGTRAYGGSAIGGLIRGWEVDPTNPAYTGRIDHPLAMSLRGEQLLYTGTDADEGFGGSYKANGYGRRRGYVWPATEQDAGSATSYTGVIPMGSYFAIPASVDIDALGIVGSAALMVAKAAQDYGVYITDSSGAAAFYIEDDNTASTTAFYQSLVGPTDSAADLRKIISALRVVTNNALATPNGGAAWAPRRGSTRGDITALASRVKVLESAAVLTVPFARKQKSANQTGTANATTNVSLNTTGVTRGSGIDTSVTDALKATTAGVYDIEFAVSLGGGDAAAPFNGILTLNFSPIRDAVCVLGTNSTRRGTRTVTLVLAAGDEVRLQVGTTSATTYTIQSGANETYMTMARRGS